MSTKCRTREPQSCRRRLTVAKKKAKPLARRPAELTVAETASPLLADLRELIAGARGAVAQAVNAGLVFLNWNIGLRIPQDILRNQRAEYGAEIVSTLSKQ